MRPYGTVGLTDGSPGFAHAEYYRSLRSEPPLHPSGPSQFRLDVACWLRSGGIQASHACRTYHPRLGVRRPHPPEELDTRQCRV